LQGGFYNLHTIFLITPRYPPATCGVGHYTQHLSGAMAAMGQKVVVVTQLKNGLWYPHAQRMQHARTLGRTLAHLRQQHPRAKLFWQYTPYNFSTLGLPFYLLPLLLRLRLGGWSQAIFFHEVSVRFWGYGVRQAALALGQRLVANGLAAVCPARVTSIGLYRSYFWGKKPTVVPVGANILPSEGAALAPSGQFELACFANRADQALFEAVAAINRHQLCRLVLLGHCHQQQQQQINTYLARYRLQALVTLTGTLPEAELGRHLQAAQIFMQPQKVERGSQGGASGKNGTLIAAMAMGKAIITTRGDMTDQSIFVDGENMLLVPYGDAHAYGRSLAQLQDAGRRAALGRAARHSFEQHFAWPVVARHIIEVLNRHEDVY
jgi:glycosyltransferase involved in cell wall biosynthesis